MGIDRIINSASQNGMTASAYAVKAPTERNSSKVTVFVADRFDAEENKDTTPSVQKNDEMNMRANREERVTREERIPSKVERQEPQTPAASQTAAKFEYNKEIDRVTITIENKDTKEVIKEIPPEETQKMLQRLTTMKGMWMDEQV